MALYGYPELGRFGLTHGLLAWARCAIWCDKTGAEMIAPIWLRPRIGPYLRRERDKRNYFLLFNHGGAISGIERAALLWSAARAEGGEAAAIDRLGRSARTVVVFRNAVGNNEASYFHHVRGHGGFLRARLLRMTRRRYHPQASERPFVAVHVRLGDFANAPVEALAGGVHNIRLSIDWYADRLVALRTALGETVRAVIFSDGTDEELAPLLSLPAVARPPRQQSITDLLAMGDGIAVISSGSGFSLWGAFLGDAPRLCHPGQMIVPAYGDPAREIESGIGDAIPANFAAVVRDRADRHSAPC